LSDQIDTTKDRKGHSHHLEQARPLVSGVSVRGCRQLSLSALRMCHTKGITPYSPLFNPECPVVHPYRPQWTGGHHRGVGRKPEGLTQPTPTFIPGGQCFRGKQAYQLLSILSSPRGSKTHNEPISLSFAACDGPTQLEPPVLQRTTVLLSRTFSSSSSSSQPV